MIFHLFGFSQLLSFRLLEWFAILKCERNVENILSLIHYTVLYTQKRKSQTIFHNIPYNRIRALRLTQTQWLKNINKQNEWANKWIKENENKKRYNNNNQHTKSHLIGCVVVICLPYCVRKSIQFDPPLPPSPLPTTTTRKTKYHSCFYSPLLKLVNCIICIYCIVHSARWLCAEFTLLNCLRMEQQCFVCTKINKMKFHWK